MVIHFIIISVILVMLFIFYYVDRSKGFKYTDIMDKYLNEPPFFKTLLFVVTVILAGIFCSAFVFEIGQDRTLLWSTFYMMDSFYYMVYVVIFDFCYNWVVHTYDDILKYNDESYCKAHVIKACLDTQIDIYKKQIENGEKKLKINDLFK